MARKSKSVADIDKEIEALKNRRLEALEAQAAHIGKIAAKAELTMLEISDADLLKEFKAIAERFRGRPAPSPGQAR
ncbi:TraC family protein [Labrenzia sp. DG1229]|uniref:TraC family protein n=1 Tax=Labrenzia sp. DG1229 TaxID=681847 RepID=UPI00048ABBAD|nr:TraC family protein [Labrenzia sp. DG1229]